MTEQQYRKIPSQHAEFLLRSHVDEGGGPEIEIVAQNCWFPSRNMTHWPHGLSAYEGMVSCGELVVSTKFLDEGDSDEVVELEYRLTPSRWAQPWHIVTQSYTGEVTVDRVELAQVQFGDASYEVDVRYDYVTHDDADRYEAFKTLIIRRRIESNKVEDLGSQKIDFAPIDDICRLIQLASRSYVACLSGVEIYRGKQTQAYRLNRTRPEAKSGKDNRHDHLIDCRHVQEFLQHAFEQLRNSGDWADRIRSAIAALVQPSSRTIEGQFIANFSALEELIEQFTDTADGTNVLGKRPFRQVRKKIEAVLTDSVPNENARDQIQRKLPELNRTPLQDRFEAFCETYGVAYQDLWPAFAGSPASLYKIRNRLVHSRSLAGAEIGAVCFAGDALQALLERSVLALLKWPVFESDVASAAFKHKYLVGKDLEALVAELEAAWAK